MHSPRPVPGLGTESDQAHEGVSTGVTASDLRLQEQAWRPGHAHRGAAAVTGTPGTDRCQEGGRDLG